MPKPPQLRLVVLVLIALSVAACTGDTTATTTIPTSTTTTLAPQDQPELSEQLEATVEMIDELTETVVAFNTLQVLWIHAVDDTNLTDDQFVTFSFETLTAQRDMAGEFRDAVSGLPTQELRDAFTPFADFFQARFWAFETIVQESLGESIEAYNNAISIYLEVADPTRVAAELGVVKQNERVAQLATYGSTSAVPAVELNGKVDGLIGLLAPS